MGMNFAIYKGNTYRVTGRWPGLVQIVSPTPDPGFELIEGGFGPDNLTMYERYCKDDELDNLYSEEIYPLYHGTYYGLSDRVRSRGNVFYFELSSSYRTDLEENGFKVMEPLWYIKIVPESEIDGAKVVRTPSPIEPFKDFSIEEELIDKADFHQWILDNPDTTGLCYED
jgi:hypothetical protein